MSSLSVDALNAPLPARWGPLQRAKNAWIYYVSRGAIWLFQRLPLSVCLGFAQWVGWLAYGVAAGERKKAMAHIAAAMPNHSAAERRRFVRGMFVHLATLATEVVHLPTILKGPPEIILTPEHRRVLDEALAPGRGVVAVTGHIGNWELLAQAVARGGYPITTIAGPLYDPRFTRLVHAERTRFGLEVIWRGGGAASAKDMLKVFKRGGILAMLLDQDTRVQGAFVPFFGKPAHTSTAAATLALRTGASVIIAWSHRVGRQHRLFFEHLPPPQCTDDRQADIVAYTALMTQRLEHAIRQRPEQWVWLHRRWKKQPLDTEVA